jgi:hypothetical protein
MLMKLQKPHLETVFDLSRHLYHNGQARAIKQVTVER